MKVHILTIGDELLIGQVIDTNSARMAQMLLAIGAQVTGKSAVGDTHEDIVQALETAVRSADIVLVTGGLGPTKDDITKKALVDFYKTGFVFHQETLERLQKIWERLGKPLTEALHEQCWMPQNATILTNKMGSAPGMWFEEAHGQVLVSMPGVPFEMEYLLEYEVIPRLQQRFSPLPSAHRTVLTAGEGESTIAVFLEKFEKNLPPAVRLAYLPAIGRVRLRLTVSDADEALVQRTLVEKFEEMVALLPPEIIAGYDDDTLESAILKTLKEKKWTLATAESCTGGYLAHLITAVPGASAAFQGGVICYANELKMKQLGVQAATLQEFGAVSEQTVREMVAGALQVLDSNVAVATSGIAGPDGGTPEKPVGTIWIAVGNAAHIETRRLNLGRDRLRNIHYTAFHTLNLLRLFLKS